MAASLLAILSGCQQLPESASVPCNLSAKGMSLGTPDDIDYAHLDPARHRIYVARDGGIDVWDADSGAPVGRIRDIDGANGIVTAPTLNRGFAVGRTTGEIGIFDLDTFEVIGRISHGKPSNGMVYDATTGMVATVSAAARDVRLIDAAAGTVIGDVPLAGSPRAIWARGNGILYVRLEHPASIVRIDLGARQLDARWPTAACKASRDLASR